MLQKYYIHVGMGLQMKPGLTSENIITTKVKIRIMVVK